MHSLESFLKKLLFYFPDDDIVFIHLLIQCRHKENETATSSCQKWLQKVQISNEYVIQCHNLRRKALLWVTRQLKNASSWRIVNVSFSKLDTDLTSLLFGISPHLADSFSKPELEVLLLPRSDRRFPLPGSLKTLQNVTSHDHGHHFHNGYHVHHGSSLAQCLVTLITPIYV